MKMRQVFREANRSVLRRGNSVDVKRSRLHFWSESVPARVSLWSESAATCVLLARKRVALGYREVTGGLGDVRGVAKPIVPESAFYNR